MKRPFPIFRVLFILVVLAVFAVGGLWAFRFELLTWRYRATIAPAAVRYGIPPRLVAAVIWQETRFHPAVAGRAGELGLMQVTPAIGQEWAKKEGLPRFRRVDLLDPGTNVMAGTWCLRRAIDRWTSRNDPLPLALAEYNAGRSNAVRWDRTAHADGIPLSAAITYPSTLQYVSAVLLRYRSFGRPWLRLGSARSAATATRPPSQ